jgi:spore maturation protein CgeB
MRILISGAISNYAIERHFLKHFKDIGLIVEVFAAQNIFLDYYSKSLFNKLLFRAGHESIYKKINLDLRKKVEEFGPDVFFVFKGMEIYPSTLQWIKSRGVKLVNYNPDNPFIFSGRGSGNKNVTDSISIFDLHLTYDTTVQDSALK